MKQDSNSLKPWLRALKYSFLRKSAEYKAQERTLNERTISTQNVAFILGCGRSGTTVLGQLFSIHNNVNYFFEPYHLWSVIDPMTDVLNLYHRINAKFMMDEADATEVAKLRFNRIFFSNVMNPKENLLLEKTPLNAMRLGYLNSLTPQAKFIHIIRNGVDVSCSIERIALTNSYKIAGKPNLNQWWGVENYKWKALSRDGALASYYPEEVELCENHRSKGAYEWLVSLGEVDRWREQLGDRLYEVTYEQLTVNPENTLRNLCKFLELGSTKLWFNQATNMIRPTPPNLRETLSLPPRMCDAFNCYQERFGFANRAIPLENICC